MDKRTLLAIVLSLLILTVWSALSPKPQPVVNQAVTSEKVALPAQTAPTAASQLAKKEIPASSLYRFSNDLYEVVFVESEAAIKEIIFKDYQSSKFILYNGLSTTPAGLIFTRESVAGNEVRFVHNAKDAKIIKTFRFSNSNYTIELEIEAQNPSVVNGSRDPAIVLGVFNFTSDPNEARFQDATVSTPDKIIRPNPRRDTIVQGARFLGIRNRYFCAVIEPEENNKYNAVVKKLNPQETEFSLALADPAADRRQAIKEKFRIYLGPQDLQYINQANPEWSIVMHYGAFNVIAHILLQALEIAYKIVHNWGLAIVILSVLVSLVLFPLTLKQMRSMKEMQAIQPRVEELRRTYKDNPQKLNKEIMELYREHKVNPLGGCLPLILQMPIFFALYQALIRSIALKGAKFLWIKDLSEPDRLFTTPFEFNILPIIMAIGMLVQQKMSMSSSGAGTSADQQKLMMILFPIMFGLIFYRMPSGLVLYWLINSMFMLFYQIRVSRSYEHK